MPHWQLLIKIIWELIHGSVCSTMTSSRLVISFNKLSSFSTLFICNQLGIFFTSSLLKSVDFTLCFIYVCLFSNCGQDQPALAVVVKLWVSWSLGDHFACVQFACTLVVIHLCPLTHAEKHWNLIWMICLFCDLLELK